MEQHKLTFVGTNDGDWAGIYVDGRLHDEGHSISTAMFIDLVLEFQNFKADVDETILDEDDLDELGFNLPDKLEDILVLIEDKI